MHETDVMKANTLPLTPVENFNVVSIGEIPEMTVISNYAKSIFFDKKFIDECSCNNVIKLQGFNEFGIFYLENKFEIESEVIRASEPRLDKNLKSTELLIEIVKEVGGDVYISGMGGRKYMEEEKFKKEGIEVKYFEFKPFEYPQRWEGFEPYMSAIDLLFNVGGERARELIKGGANL